MQQPLLETHFTDGGHQKVTDNTHIGSLKVCPLFIIKLLDCS